MELPDELLDKIDAETALIARLYDYRNHSDVKKAKLVQAARELLSGETSLDLACAHAGETAPWLFDGLPPIDNSSVDEIADALHSSVILNKNTSLLSAAFAGKARTRATLLAHRVQSFLGHKKLYGYDEAIAPYLPNPEDQRYTLKLTMCAARRATGLVPQLQKADYNDMLDETITGGDLLVDALERFVHITSFVAANSPKTCRRARLSLVPSGGQP